MIFRHLHHLLSPTVSPKRTKRVPLGYVIHDGQHIIILTHKHADFSKVSFEAIFMLHDSREWGRDIQYAVDLMRSDGGVFGTVLTNEEIRARKPIPIYFSHGDLLWGNDFSVARLGQGAFRTALEAVFHVRILLTTYKQRVTNGIQLNAHTFGKPETSTYEYANGLLQELLLSASKDSCAQIPPENVWMIGDNPYSDILGTHYHRLINDRCK